MKPLVREVVLPAKPMSEMQRIKTALGLDGVAVRLRRMGVPPLAAELMEAQETIDAVTGFAHDLWERYVTDAEMPTKVIDVSRVNALVGTVLDGGLESFVLRAEKPFAEGTRAGLRAIGASEHLAVFEGAWRMAEAGEGAGGVDIAQFRAAIERLESEQLSNARLSRRLGRGVDDSWTWGDRWQCVQFLSAKYIAGWRDVRRVAPDAYPAALDKLAAGIPDLAARRRMRDDARPWEKKAIDRLVAAAFYSDVWYTAFGTREHDGRKVWCWNFTVGKTPGQGHHQAIFVDGEAIMFKGDTDLIVARLPAPECAPRSGVARNEPQQEPGTEGPNILIGIDNP